MHIDCKLYHKRLRRVRVVVALVGLLMWLTSSISLVAGPTEGADIDALVQAMTLDEKRFSFIYGM